MNLKLKIWRQAGPQARGYFQDIEAKDISEECSFLEMLDIVCERMEEKGEEPIAFDHDCREGICGACSLIVNGVAHGPEAGTTVCQLHMRTFKDGETIVVEPWRARAFPVLKDLIVDRTSFDRIIEAGGYISVNTGAAPDAHSLPVRRENAEMSMDAAACIGCGACVAACKNASAMLFVSAKVTHLNLLPQGKPEAMERVQNMVRQMDREGFGNCTNTGECEAVCPKEIKMENISRLNLDFIKSSFVLKNLATLPRGKGR